MSIFLDKVIVSVRWLYLSIFSLLLIYAYASTGLYEHHQALRTLIALDKLLAIRSIVRPNQTIISDQATLKDLPRFFSRATEEFGKALEAAEKKLDAELDAAVKDAEEADAADLSAPPESQNVTPDSKQSAPTDFVVPNFTPTPVNGARIYKDVPMRLAVGAACNLLVTDFRPGAKFTFITFQVVGEIYSVASENARLITFKNCSPGPARDFSAIAFSLPDGQFAFAIPETLGKAFPGLVPPLPFEAFAVHGLEDSQKALPAPIDRYAALDQPLIALHIRAIDYYILNYADVRLSTFFRADEFENAIQRLYQEKEKDASYLGITATGSLIVKFGPLIYFALCFELWRRVRLLPDRKIRSNEYWFAFEAHDRVGKAYAYLAAIAPLLFGFVLYVLFAVSQDLG